MIVFEDFEFVPESGELRNTAVGTTLRLRPKSAAVLACLLDRAGEVVSRDAIASAVWAGTFIEYDLGVNACIKELRAALADDASNPRFIETLPRRGYRFKAPVVTKTAPAPRGRSLRAIAYLSAAVVTVAAGALGWWWVGDGARRITVAVLPVETLDDDPQSEYLAGVLTADVISDLARTDVERLGVIAKTSTNRYRGTATPVTTIGRELDADYVVEGTLRRDRGDFRIALRMIRVRDQVQVWAEEYYRDVAHVVARLPGEVATRVRQDLRIEDRAVGRSVVVALPADSAFRDDYLRARHLLSTRSHPATALAESLLTRALATEANFAPAWDALAETRARLGRLADARAALDSAVTLAPSYPDALARRALVRLVTDLDIVGARRDLNRARDVAPGLAFTRSVSALLLFVEGDSDAALRESESALRLDPVSPLIRGDVGWFFLYAGRTADALRHCTRAAELDPEQVAHRRCRLTALLVERQPAEARREAIRLLTLDGQPDSLVATVAEAGAADGLRRYWDLVASGIFVPSRSPLAARAAANAQLGKTAEAVQALEDALSVLPRLDLLFLIEDPLLDPIRKTGEFQAFRARLDEVVLRS